MRIFYVYLYIYKVKKKDIIWHHFVYPVSSMICLCFYFSHILNCFPFEIGYVVVMSYLHDVARKNIICVYATETGIHRGVKLTKIGNSCEIKVVHNIYVMISLFSFVYILYVFSAIEY